jgi:hypothetical protein
VKFGEIGTGLKLRLISGATAQAEMESSYFGTTFREPEGSCIFQVPQEHQYLLQQFGVATFLNVANRLPK